MITLEARNLHKSYTAFLPNRKGRGSLKAILTTEYGPPLDVLQLRQVATPEPTEAEVLVKLFASSVNPLDDFAIRGPLFFVPQLGRLLKPTHKIAGADYAGIIESAGRDIKRFRPGDAVFGASFIGKDREALPSMCVLVKTPWRRNQPISRSNKRQRCPSRRLRLFRVSAIMARFGPGRRF